LVGGATELTKGAQETGAKSGWIGYVEVKDPDATAKRIKQLGGVVHVPPTEVPNVSRYCIFADPQKARLAAFKWLKAQTQPSESSFGSRCLA
jgi:uncharacterized protein